MSHVISMSHVPKGYNPISHRTSWEFVSQFGFEYSVITKKRKFTRSFLVRCPSQLEYRENSTANLACAIVIPGMPLVSAACHYVTNVGP